MNADFNSEWMNKQVIRMDGSRDSFHRLIKIIYDDEANLTLNNVEDTIKSISAYEVGYETLHWLTVALRLSGSDYLTLNQLLSVAAQTIE